MNYYQILGLKKNCNKKEIKIAFRKKSKTFHPDLNNGYDDEFIRIKKAYDTLIDDNLRLEYDSSLKRNYTDMQLEIDQFIVEYIFEDILNNDIKFDQFMSYNKLEKQEFLNSICDYHLKEQKNYLAKKETINKARLIMCLDIVENDSSLKLYQEMIEENNKILNKIKQQIEFLELAKKRITVLIKL